MRNPSPPPTPHPTPPVIPNHAQTAPIVYPIAAEFNLWYNQGGATLTDHGESVTLDVPSSGAANELRCVGQAAPAAPYVLTAKLQLGSQLKNYHSAGLVVLDNATDRAIHFAVDYQGVVSVDQWTDTSTFNSNLGATNVWLGWMGWWKIEDDNVDLIFSVSREGLFWYEVFRHARTTWLASPDRLLLGNQAYNQAAPQANVWETCQSWAVS